MTNPEQIRVEADRLDRIADKLHDATDYDRAVPMAVGVLHETADALRTALSSTPTPSGLREAARALLDAWDKTEFSYFGGFKDLCGQVENLRAAASTPTPPGERCSCEETTWKQHRDQGRIVRDPNCPVPGHGNQSSSQ